MRYLRMIFVAVLAIALVTVSLANRQVVQVSLLPGQFASYVGHSWSAGMPLFLVIILALLAGMILGVIWEWLREAHLRQESARRASALNRLEHEVGGLRITHAAPRDEVLAILDAPRPAGNAALAKGAATQALPPALR
ncbi:hypothetical protein B0A89_00505 [Paracoccus contaminans]|uniref:Lipopolysaccharide assembly protein A domain-containing protein n=2 Tax=Paracoccus contaminans TaxID=1945662 RepID=A0A1W6D0H4_9RHOB|nr:hypothetical protein B0A89_00505 [Paracoccus contaminans]